MKNLKYLALSLGIFFITSTAGELYAQPSSCYITLLRDHHNPVVAVPRLVLKRRIIELSVAMGLNMDVRARSYKIRSNPDLNIFKSGQILKI